MDPMSPEFAEGLAMRCAEKTGAVTQIRIPGLGSESFPEVPSWQAVSHAASSLSPPPPPGWLSLHLIPTAPGSFLLLI